jgi:hypothetical protein
LTFVDKVKSELRFKARYGEVTEVGGMYALREQSEAYAGAFASESDVLMPGNSVPWEKNAVNTTT